MSESTVPDSKSRKNNIGWAIAIFAISLPFVLSTIGLISAFNAGRFVVQIGFSWLLLAVVIGAVVKKRDLNTRENGRIIAATLTLAIAATICIDSYRDSSKVDTARRELAEEFMKAKVEQSTNPQFNEPTSKDLLSQNLIPQVNQGIGQLSEADRAVRLLEKMKNRAKQFAQESAAIDRKFNSVDLSTVLSPQNLIDIKGIQISIQKLNQMRVIISERDAMIKNHFEQCEKIIRESSLTEKEVKEGLAGLYSEKQILQNYADLTKAQLESARAIENILSFAGRKAGNMAVQNGQISFKMHADYEEYQDLLTSLNNAAKLEDAVTQRVQMQAQRSKEAIVRELN